MNWSVHNPIDLVKVMPIVSENLEAGMAGEGTRDGPPCIDDHHPCRRRGIRCLKTTCPESALSGNLIIKFNYRTCPSRIFYPIVNVKAAQSMRGSEGNIYTASIRDLSNTESGLLSIFKKFDTCMLILKRIQH